MDRKSFSCRKAIRSSFHALRKSLPSIFLFEIIYQGLTIAIFKPLLSIVIQTMLNISGYKLAFNGTIFNFFTSFYGLLSLAILGILAALIIYYEFAVIIIIAYYNYHGKPINLKFAMKMALVTLGNLKNVGIVGFCIYAIVLLPLDGLGLTSSLIPHLAIPDFINTELSKTIGGTALILLFGFLIAILCQRLIYLLPVMILERKNFWKAVKRTQEILKKTSIKIIIVFALFAFTWFILFMIPGIIIALFFDVNNIFIIGFKDIFSTLHLSWKAFIALIALLLFYALQQFFTPIMLALITYIYSETDCQATLIDEDILAVSDKLRKGRLFFRNLTNKLVHIKNYLLNYFDLHFSFAKHKFKIIVIGVILCFIPIIINITEPSPKITPVVIGHRGSAYGVENTLGAIQSAIDAGADYAEIDILLSSDQIPVVVHDTNLKRLSGRNVNVYDLTAKELSEITLSQNDYTGNISTLDEVIKYCKGKIKLLIEFKLHGHETADIIEETMQVIEYNNSTDQCIFQTLEYDLTQQMKSKYPDSTIGYVIYGNIGTPNKRRLQNLNIDFLSTEVGFVSKKLIKACRRAGIPIYAWTVNYLEDMESIWKLKVDGMITDEPASAKDVLQNMDIIK